MQDKNQGSVVSMERLHKIVNSGRLSGLRTGGVFDGGEVGEDVPEGEYTLWILTYLDGRTEQVYTLD